MRSFCQLLLRCSILWVLGHNSRTIKNPLGRRSRGCFVQLLKGYVNWFVRASDHRVALVLNRPAAETLPGRVFSWCVA